MNKMLSRACDGLDHDAREAARAAARRSGKSLDEWLTDAIFEKAEAVSRDDEDFGHGGDGDPPEAARRRFTQAEEHGRFARPKEPRRWREESPRQNVARYLDDRDDASSRRSRLQDSLMERPRSFRKDLRHDAEAIAESAVALAARQRRTMKALENIVDLIESKLCRFDPQAVEKAIAAMEQRVRESERKTAEALSDIADLIETAQKGGSKASEDRGVWGRFGRASSKAA